MRAIGITGVALLQIGEKICEFSRNSLRNQLAVASLGPFLGTGRQKNLEGRLREDDSSHISAIGDQSRGFCKAVLQLQQGLSHRCNSADPRCAHASGLRSNGLTDIGLTEVDAIPFKPNRHIGRNRGNALRVIRFG